MYVFYRGFVNAECLLYDV